MSGYGMAACGAKRTCVAKMSAPEGQPGADPTEFAEGCVMGGGSGTEASAGRAHGSRASLLSFKHGVALFDKLELFLLLSNAP